MSPLVDVRETARLLSISPWTVRALIRCGKLQPIRVGRRVLLSESELGRFVSTCSESGEITKAPENQQKTSLLSGACL
jgi:excisionase family DNA binding protein